MPLSGPINGDTEVESIFARLASAGYMHEANLFLVGLIEGLNGFGRWLNENLASFVVEIIAGLWRQAHVPFLTRSNN